MKTEYADHFDFYTRGPYAPFVRETRSAGTDPIRMLHAAQPEGDFSDPSNPNLVMIEALRAKRPFIRDLGVGLARHQFRQGDLELQPPNTPTQILAEGEHEIRVFALPFGRVKSALATAYPNCDGDFGRLHDAPFRDFFLEQLCRRLWEESEAGNPHGDLFADAALVTVAATLAGLADRKVGQKDGMPLADGVQANVRDFIDANLDGNPGLGELAGLADMPEASFLRAFKATTGKTPHQYVLSRRIARAQELLAAGEMPLAEVAYACGFASQSHMTDVFREKLGVTPGRYRKEVRS